MPSSDVRCVMMPSINVTGDDCAWIPTECGGSMPAAPALLIRMVKGQQIMRLYASVLLIALIAVALVGCGGDDDDDDDEPAAATATTASSGASGTPAAGTFTVEQLETFGTSLVQALASGDPAALTAVLGGLVPQERIDELAACKTDDMTFSNIDVHVAVDPPSMQLNGTVDRTQNGETETLVVLWDTELSEVSPGLYTMSGLLPSGCPFIFQ
jgi:hypothetical protein